MMLFKPYFTDEEIHYIHNVICPKENFPTVARFHLIRGCNPVL